MNGKIIHKLRGHDKTVLSLAWCPAPINIFPKHPSNFVGPKKTKLECNGEIGDVNSKPEGECESETTDQTLDVNPTIKLLVLNQENKENDEEIELDKKSIPIDQTLDVQESECDAITQSLEVKPTSEVVIPNQETKEKDKEIELNKLGELVPLIDFTIKNPTNVHVLQIENATVIKSNIDKNSMEDNGCDNSNLNTNEVVENEVNTLCEIPKAIPIEEEPRKEFLLASSAKEK